MKKSFLKVFLLLLLVMTGCNQLDAEPIDGKVSGAVFGRVQSVAGSQPIGFDLKNMSIDWVENSYKEIQTLADPWLQTLKPTHEINKFPLKKYIHIYYSDPYDQNENIDLFIPYPNDGKAHKNIILKGKDNGMTHYYVFEGGEKETERLIDWMMDHEPNGVNKGQMNALFIFYTEYGAKLGNGWFASSNEERLLISAISMISFQIFITAGDS
jgi:hypothetical protein